MEGQGIVAKKKWVYYFGGGKAEGMVFKTEKERKAILGGKGSGLADMTAAGLPVPPGFTISTEACREYFENGGKWPTGLKEEVASNLKRLEKEMGKKFGDPKDPLLVSVRSGAAASMPGMMDTILNLGLSDAAVQGLAKKTDNERFAWDAYRRLIQMFGDVVMGVPKEEFNHALVEAKRACALRKGTKEVEGLPGEAVMKKVPDTMLEVEDLKALVTKYKEVYRKHTGSDFPQDPRVQLEHAINAVFKSWNNERAVAYRKIHDIKGLIGTAVNVQTMVFGNKGNTSGTGVAFTRDPATGENVFYGEYLMNAQGEDVVAGIRTPQPISELEKSSPKIYSQLVAIRKKLEKHYRDMQDTEFTIEEGRLFMLQTRNGKRTAQAAVKIAVDMVKEGLITKEEALMRIEPASLDQLLHPTFDSKALKEAKPIAKGLNAGPGAAVGRVVFSAKDAEEWTARGEKVILVRIETSPEDIKGMHAAQGILTSRGGRTSHAAVVARQMGKCCVAGAEEVHIDYEKKQLESRGVVVKEGEDLSLDGSAGNVYAGRLPTKDPELTGDFATIMKWADEVRRLGVWLNAQTPRDAEVGARLGAEGIGLARTERMFYEGDRITSMRKMIMAKDLEARKAALAELLPHQRSDFEALFKVMNGKPVTIRTLDPPLHEFLPVEEPEQRKMAEALGVSLEAVKAKVAELHEFNPMLGHRGVRLEITSPEIPEMQVRAIIEAALNVKKQGIVVKPKIMIPLVGHKNEIRIVADIVRKTAEKVFEERKDRIDYEVGTMIEVPRACVTAHEIAEVAEFFSFGTNDLTQAGSAFSRDDAAKFLKVYLEKNVYEKDPFEVLDQNGIGELVRIGIERGRSTRPDLEVGICGEHGGDPATIKFCHRVGMNYVSCSPYRVPIARLAAAQAALEEKLAAKAAGVKAAKKKGALKQERGRR